MEPWRVCRRVFADSHRFNEEQDPDADRIKVMRIRIPDLTTKYCNNILGEESDQHVILSDSTRHANYSKTKNNLR
jgi:hypothetical protein